MTSSIGFKTLLALMMVVLIHVGYFYAVPGLAGFVVGLGAAFAYDRGYRDAGRDQRAKFKKLGQR